VAPVIGLTTPTLMVLPCARPGGGAIATPAAAATARSDHDG